MSRWRDLQRENIGRAVSIEHAKTDIIKRDVHWQRVYGAVYYKENTPPLRGVLLVHGIFSRRYGMEVLAERLAEYGFFCLSIDLPSHFMNAAQLSMGEISETVTDGVAYLRNVLGSKSVAVVGHSLGAVGALFSNAGYSTQVEQEMVKIWPDLQDALTGFSTSSQKNDTASMTVYGLKIEEKYSYLKTIILATLRRGIEQNTGVQCYVFLSAPRNIKRVVPGMRFLTKSNLSKLRNILIKFNEAYARIKGVLKPGDKIIQTPAGDPF